MGTTWQLAAYVPPTRSADTTDKRMRAVFEDICLELSTWEPESFISRFNDAPASTRMRPPALFANVMQAAITVADATDGAFDPCLGREIGARGFGSPRLQAAVVDTASANWNTKRPYVSGAELVQPGGLLLDLSAVAKGYAVDLMAQSLLDFGADSFLAEIGGEFVGRGVRQDGQPWWVEIEGPTANSSPWRTALCGLALATSGDIQASQTENRHRQSHIVPWPGAGEASSDLVLVTVLHNTCMFADAWATALYASGPKRGLERAESHDIAALFQFNDQPPLASRCLSEMLA